MNPAISFCSNSVFDPIFETPLLTTLVSSSTARVEVLMLCTILLMRKLPLVCSIHASLMALLDSDTCLAIWLIISPTLACSFMDSITSEENALTRPNLAVDQLAHLALLEGGPSDGICHGRHMLHGIADLITAESLFPGCSRYFRQLHRRALDTLDNFAQCAPCLQRKRLTCLDTLFGKGYCVHSLLVSL